MYLTNVCFDVCLKGGQLIDVIRARHGPLPCDEVLQAFYQTCSAVHHMHRQRPPIIHRDLKVLLIRLLAALCWEAAYVLHSVCLVRPSVRPFYASRHTILPMCHLTGDRPTLQCLAHSSRLDVLSYIRCSGEPLSSQPFIRPTHLLNCQLTEYSNNNFCHLRISSRKTVYMALFRLTGCQII